MATRYKDTSGRIVQVFHGQLQGHYIGYERDNGYRRALASGVSYATEQAAQTALEALAEWRGWERVEEGEKCLR